MLAVFCDRRIAAGVREGASVEALSGTGYAVAPRTPRPWLHDLRSAGAALAGRTPPGRPAALDGRYFWKYYRALFRPVSKCIQFITIGVVVKIRNSYFFRLQAKSVTAYGGSPTYSMGAHLV